MKYLESYNNYHNVKTDDIDFRGDIWHKLRNEMLEKAFLEIVEAIKTTGLFAKGYKDDMGFHKIDVNGVPMEIHDEYFVQFDVDQLFIANKEIDEEVLNILRKNNIGVMKDQNKQFRFSKDILHFFEKSGLLAATRLKATNANKQTGIFE